MIGVFERLKQKELEMPGLQAPLTRPQVKQYRTNRKSALQQKFGLNNTPSQVVAVSNEPEIAASPLSFWEGYALNPRHALTKEIIDNATIPGIVDWVLANYLDGHKVGKLNALVYKLLKLDVMPLNLNSEQELEWITHSYKESGAGMNNLRALLRALAFPGSERANGKKALLLAQADLRSDLTLESLVDQIQAQDLSIPLELYVRTVARQDKLRKLVSMLGDHSRNILLFGSVERHSPLREAARFLGEIFHEIATEVMGLTVADMLNDEKFNLHPDNLNIFGVDQATHRKFPKDEELIRYFQNYSTNELKQWFPEYSDQIDNDVVLAALEQIEEDSSQRRIFLRLFYLFSQSFKIMMAQTESEFPKIAEGLELTLEEFGVIHIAAIELVGKNFRGGVVEPLLRLSRYIWRVQAMIHHGKILTSSRFNSDKRKEQQILHIAVEKMFRIKIFVPEFQVYHDAQKLKERNLLHGMSNGEYVKPDVFLETDEGIVIVDWKSGTQLRSNELEITAVSYALAVHHALATYPGDWDTSGPSPIDEFKIPPLPGYVGIDPQGILEKLQNIKVVYAGIAANQDIVVRVDEALLRKYWKLLEVGRFEGKKIEALYKGAEA